MKNSAYKKSVTFELRQMVYFIPFFKIRSGTWGLKEHGQSYYQNFFCSYKMWQNMSNNVKRSSEYGQYYKSLTSTFACFLTAIAKF